MYLAEQVSKDAIFIMFTQLETKESEVEETFILFLYSRQYATLLFIIPLSDRSDTCYDGEE